MPESNLISPIPTELNGYPVIRSERHRNTATVMMAKPTSENPTEYIVATWFPELNQKWVWGHYFLVGRGDSIQEAKKLADECFFEIRKRNEAR